MKFLNKLNEKNNYSLILFFIILINYLPLFINNAFSKESKSVNIIIMIFSFVLEIALLLIFYFLNRKQLKINNKKIVILFVVIGLMTIVQINNLLKNDFLLMDIFNIGCIFVNIFLLYVVSYNLETKEDKLINFFKGIWYIGLIATIWNFILFNKEILSCLGWIKFNFNPHINGTKSFFANRNSLAFFLFVAIVSNSILMIFENDKKRYKVSLFVLIFGVWCTYSKTGWAIAIAFLEMFFALNDRYKIKEKIFICLIIAIIGLIGFMNITGKINLNSNTNNSVSSPDYKRLSGRTDIWKKGFNILNESPLNYIFGVGRFKSTSSLEFKTKSFTQFHNVYLDILLTGGLVQLIYTGFIYLSVIIKVVKSKMNNNFKKTYIIMLVMYAAYIMMESCGRFSIGAVDTLCMIFFITIPILHANSCTEIDEKEGKKKWLL